MVESYTTFFGRTCGFAPFPYQAALGGGPPPEVLAVPTGFGKTEAVVVPWLHAHAAGAPDSTRLFYVLPMRVLVEQIGDRVAALVDRAGLARAVSVHITMGGARDDDWVRDPSRPAVIVGTQDLLVSRMLLRGYAAYPGVWPMQFALLHNDATWVLDEVQLFGAALPTTRQLQTFRERLGTCGNARAVWMSATVPEAEMATVDRPEVPAAVGITDDDRRHPGLGRRWRAVKRPELREDPPTADDIADAHRAARDRHGDRAVTLVVLNTVKAAQDLHRRAVKALRGTPVVLLHSRYRPPDRAARTADVLRVAGGGGVIVATQVVEAGVDLDAHVLVTELCPWPSLVQRLGRLNRRGQQNESLAFLHVPPDDQALNKLDGKPYRAADLAAALAALQGRDDLSPAALAAIPAPAADPEVRAVLRRTDLDQLWDTSPGLEGQHTSVSRFVRDIDDAGVWVGWRDGAPDAAEPALTRDELCQAPVGDVAAFLAKGRSAWLRDRVDGDWRPLQGRPRPGMTLRLAVTAGGYDLQRGWDPTAKPPVPPVPAPPALEDEAAAGDVERLADRPVTLVQHGRDARAQATTLVGGPAGRDLDPGLRVAVTDAAAWHDLGKAHGLYQTAVRRINPDLQEPLYAKSGATGRLRYDRRHFRHEAASALRVAAALDDGALTTPDADLAVYLVGAHHGKVRTVLPLWPDEQPRDAYVVAGLADGDDLPAVEADPGVVLDAWTVSGLDKWAQQAGGRWVELAERLLETHGPFRLAYLETLVRAADWAASARPGGGTS